MALLELGPATLSVGDALRHDAGSSGDAADEFPLAGLFAAVAEADAQKVHDALLTLPATCDLNQRSDTGDTVAHVAVRSESLAVLQALADRGVDVHQLNANCENGLHIACRENRRQVAEFLINNSCICLDAQTRDGDSALHLAAKAGHCDLVRLLCQRGASVHTRDRLQRSVLHTAAERGSVDCVRALLLAGAELNCADRSCCSPLLLAIAAGQEQVALLLINAGACVDQPDAKLERPLHYAARMGQLHVVQALCAFGCTVDQHSAAGVTPLHVASRAGHVEIVRCLLLAGANPQTASSQGVVPEVMALAQGHNAAASLLGRMRPERRVACVEQLVPTQRQLSRIKLKLFGNSASGKSSLVDSLRSNLITGFFRRRLKAADDAGGSSEDCQYFSMRQRSVQSEISFEALHEAYTRGVCVQNLQLGAAGDFSVWEFSGYEPYFVFYDHFIGDSSCVHAIVFSLDDSYEAMLHKVLFWLQFVLSRLPAREPLGFCGRPRAMPRILLIGTHADKALTERNDQGLLHSHDAQRVLYEVIQLAQYRADVCQQVFVVDSNEAASAEMKALRQRLGDWRDEILRLLPRSNGFLEAVAAKVAEWAADTQFPVMTWQQFIDSVRSRVNPLCSEEHLKDLVQELQYTGEIVYLECEHASDMIVLNPQWLCTTMLGHLLSCDNIAQARVTGSFTADDIQFMIAEAEANQLLPLLTALDLCTPVEIDDEVQYEFPSLNFLESLHGLWEREIRHENSVYAGLQLRAAKSQLLHIFPRIQCSMRRSLQQSTGILVAADLFQWFHGSKLSIDCVECLLRVEDLDQVIRLRVRGPPKQQQLMFGIFHDLQQLIEQTIEDMCPALEYQMSALAPKELKRHSKLVIPVPQSVLYAAILQQQQQQQQQLEQAEEEKTKKENNASIVINYEDGLVTEPLQELVCFGSQQLLQQLHFGPQLHISCLRAVTFQRLCRLLDPPHPHGKDWCLLAVRLALTHTLPNIDSSSEWLRSRTASILNEWAASADATVGRLLLAMQDMGRTDVCDLLLSQAPLYAYAAARQGQVEGEAVIEEALHSD